MGIFRSFPIRKVKTLLVVGFLLIVVKLLWASFYSSSSEQLLQVEPNIIEKDQEEHAHNGVIHMMQDIVGRQFPESHDSNKALPERPESDRKIKNEPTEKTHTCQPIENFRKYSPDSISTFDLLNETDFSMDARLRYKIPGPFNEAKDPVLGPLEVIVVPFSHADPGYGNTVEGYYQSMTKSVLDNMVRKLTQYPNMTFQWAETVFLERWFRDISDQQKQQVQTLIQNGQLEIVLGSWVMPDEAVTHYVPVVDQLIEGHQWVRENLGVIPTNAWINDPFGYSSTMPYLWKSCGVDNMVILRIHQAVKGTLMKKRGLDFKWRPLWRKDSQEDILCNLMPYPGYWNSDVCGPDQTVCSKFNYLHMMDGQSSGVAVSDSNIESLATEFYQAYRYTSSLYKYNTLVMFIGEDNSYTSQSAWDDTYKNYQKLMDFVNSKPEWNMHIKFGTVREYFSKTRQNEAKMRQSGKTASPNFPVLSGDFLPYSDWEDAYWTGFYATRAWLKKFSREIGPILHAGDIYSVVLHNFCQNANQCGSVTQILQDIAEDLRTARRELGIFQHHDGITGTCLPFVASDYEQRLLTAFVAVRKALRRSLVLLLSKGKETDPDALQAVLEKSNSREITRERLLTIGHKGLRLVVANPLEKRRKDIVSVLVTEKQLKITSDSPNLIPYQVAKPALRNGFYMVSFLMELDPLAVTNIKIEVDRQLTVSEIQQETISLPIDDSHPPVIIENAYMKIIFNSKTGFIETVIDSEGRESKMSLDFYKYDSTRSGAYLFAANGPAQPMDDLRQVSKLVLNKGPLMSEAVFSHGSTFTHTVRLYNVNGPKGRCIFINNEIQAVYSNADFVMRFDTDIDNAGHFFTDQNGFQLIGRRTFPERLIESNFYPITSMAVIEDQTKRLTLHVEQPHGVASLSSGQLEVLYDRNNNFDDKRGLGMGANEKVFTLGEFVLQIEYKSEKGDSSSEMRFSQPTVNSIAINEQFQNKLQLFSVSDTSNIDIKDSVKPLADKNPFPCDTAIVGLRNLVSNNLTYTGTSLILHRKPVHCNYPAGDLQCDVISKEVTSQDLALGKQDQAISVTETSLSHLYEQSKMDPDSDLRPEPYELRSFLIKSKV